MLTEFSEKLSHLAVPRHGTRHLEAVLPQLRSLLTTEPWAGFLAPFFPGPPQLVRTLYFNKTPGANWGVAWHQDKTIAVQQRREIDGFGPWSMKQGVIHVQPPSEILAQILTLRLHLDDTDAENGALQVMPGSHRHGVLSRVELEQFKQERSSETCCLKAGDVLLMRPLLLHASRKSQTERDRRVIHLELTYQELPSGLQWAMG